LIWHYSILKRKMAGRQKGRNHAFIGRDLLFSPEYTECLARQRRNPKMGSPPNVWVKQKAIEPQMARMGTDMGLK